MVGRWANKYVIGLTGNIAMGKSVVRKMLEQLGAYTIDADGLAHQTMAPGAPAYQPIIETFGKWILDGEGRIDRSKLGAVAFSHPEALARLEAITHPIVGHGIDTLIARAKQPIIVLEAIKLLEGNLAAGVDTIWVVDATPETQLSRLKEKRGMSEAEARKRIEGQNPQREKLARAAVVIRNNGSPQDLWAQVEREWLKLIDSLRPKAPTPPPAPVVQAPVKATQTTAPVQQPVQAPAAPPPEVKGAVEIKRGTPKNAEMIAQFINAATGKHLGRMDVMAAFGEKSYLLAESGGRTLGLAGFQVENLITRMDEFLLTPDAPVDVVAPPLIRAVEDASKELQSEVGFVYLPMNGTASVLQAFVNNGYERMEVEQIKIPSWREAAAESQPPNTLIMAKKLRAERVLKPL